jgi:beta-phosphoglucomutase-like phosphatase (HAD superfamily)
MVIKAAEKLNLNPDQCAMIGDSTYDILAGKVAGCYTVAVCTKHPKKVFADIKTDLVLESITSMKDLLPLKFSKKN